MEYEDIIHGDISERYMTGYVMAETNRDDAEKDEPASEHQNIPIPIIHDSVVRNERDAYTMY